MRRAALTATKSTYEAFFGRAAEVVAPELLGSYVSASGVTVRLSEVEAYAGLDDPASHAFRGETPRTAVMFGPPARVYVYFVYGAHWAVNLVCQRDGIASAVLLRAGEVVDGEAGARARRGEAVSARQLARGPGNLAAALGATGAMTGSRLWDGPVRWRPRDAESPHPLGMHEIGPRVGVNAAAETPWRMWVPGDHTVSSYRRHKPRRR